MIRKVKNKAVWILLVVLIITAGYLALLSDPPEDESIKFVEIDRYLSKANMSKDLDTLTHLFEKVHPNAYRFIDQKQFLAAVDSIKRQLPDSLSTINFWRIIDRVIISYNDAHSRAEDTYVLTDYVKKNRLFFPFAARLYNNKIYISNPENGEQLIPKGAEIIQINGVSDKMIIRDLLKHATKETLSLKQLEISDDFGFYIWKTYDWNSVFTIHYKCKEKFKADSIVVKGAPWKSRIKTKTVESESYVFELLEPQVGYMKITDFNGDEKEIEHFYKQSFQTLQHNNSSHLILDFRGHSGGADSYGEQLAKYFSKVPYRKLSKAYWNITPEFKEAFDRRFVPKGIRWFKPIYLVNEYSSVFYGSKPHEVVTVHYEMKTPLPSHERFQGQVYLITDHNTFSAGSIFAEMFSFYNMGKIIGQPTGNLYSFNGFALASFSLPNSKLTFQISSVYNVANNGEEGLKSVMPDILLNQAEDPLKYIFDNFIRNKN